MEQISSRLCYRDGGDGADPGTGERGCVLGIPPPKKVERARGSGAGIAVI